jgi:UPF0755 protein
MGVGERNFMAGGKRRRDRNEAYDSSTYFAAQRDYGALPRSPSEHLEPDYAPEPPEGRPGLGQHPAVKILNNVVTLMFVGVIGLALLFYYVRVQFDQPGPLQYSTVVVVPKGDGVREIASRLEREGVISDQRIFVAAVVLYFQAQSKLKAGEYAMAKGASMRSVLDTLIEGKAILQNVTLPEGLTSYQIVQRLKAHPELTGRIDIIPPEGTLMPDTYRFERGTDRNELIARMQNHQRRFIEKVWAERATDLPFRTTDQAITLASIVEKETGKVDERARVAAVFVNRLRKNMRLQSDPTIIYGLSGGKGTLGRGILRSEIQQMTPYNTYTIKGLPPTPIANPGRAAIEAVLRPAKTNDLFFVADGTGGHKFSETYEQHKEYVAEWRVIEKGIRERQKARAEAEAKAKALGTEETQQAAAETDSTVIPAVAVTVSSSNGGTTTTSTTVPNLEDPDEVPVPERNPKF